MTKFKLSILFSCLEGTILATQVLGITRCLIILVSRAEAKNSLNTDKEDTIHVTLSMLQGHEGRL